MALRIAGNSSGGSSDRMRRPGGGGNFGNPSKKVSSGTLKRPGPVAPQPRDLHQGRFDPAPVQPARNVSRSSSPYGGVYGGGDGGYGGGGPVEPVAPAVPTEEDYLAGDATYNATISALKKQLESFQTDVGMQRENRKLDYNTALKDLGYIAPGEGATDPSWNWEDTLTASGRAYQNQNNDFAARGMLQSQGYADSLENLSRSLMDQYTGIDQSNTQFNTDLDRQVTKAKDENTAASQAARAEAIMRRAAQYGFGV